MKHFISSVLYPTLSVLLLINPVASAQENPQPVENQQNQQQAPEGQQAPAEQPRQRPAPSWNNADKLTPAPGLTHHLLDSKAVGEKVGYVVYLPPSYEQEADRDYPVIFFLHGAGGSESSDAAGFSGHAAKAMADGTLPESIIVFPNGVRSGYRGEVEQMIVEELVPLIDETYRTLSEPGSPKNRVASGFSMGGAGSTRLALSHPNLFEAVVSWGGGVGGRGGEGASPILDTARQNADTLRSNDFAMFVVNGDQDRPDAFDGLVTLFEELDIPITRVVLPDTRHNLGHYYERSGPDAFAFLAEQLENE